MGSFGGFGATHSGRRAGGDASPVRRSARLRRWVRSENSPQIIDTMRLRKWLRLADSAQVLHPAGWPGLAVRGNPGSRASRTGVAADGQPRPPDEAQPRRRITALLEFHRHQVQVLRNITGMLLSRSMGQTIPLPAGRPSLKLESRRKTGRKNRKNGESPSERPTVRPDLFTS